ncbi:MAG: sirohydrochlorin chelatase, partial [Gemmatimonadales bacterium]
MRFVARTVLAVAVAALSARVASALAQAAPDHESDGPAGVLIVAHGADRDWNAPVDSLAAMVRHRGRFAGPVAVSFLMGPEAPAHRFQDAIDDLARAGARRVIVVPLLVSRHSGHYEQVRFLAGETDTLDAEMTAHLRASGITRPTASVPLHVTAALDDAPELARVVVARALSLAPDPSGHALFLFGHGPNSAEDYAAWMRNLRVVADSVRHATRFASVVVELVRDDAPPSVRAEAVQRARELIQLQYAATRHYVVVVPLLVSAGDVSRRKMPADLTGLPIVYSGAPLLPDSILA